MAKEYWTITEVVETFQVEECFIEELEKEEIICPTCLQDHSTRHYSAYELDKLRLAKILIEDMDVNMPGVEVILRIRHNMIQMREQFDDILEDLAIQIKEAFGD
ncbi:MerR family transcriptional regulator [Deltaproteobacteria bacterium]|nr:MerR family transcriptional regulator [Deltaproteobacteria bacterium]